MIVRIQRIALTFYKSAPFSATRFILSSSARIPYHALFSKQVQCCGIGIISSRRVNFLSSNIHILYFCILHSAFQLTYEDFLMRIKAHLWSILISGIKIYSDWLLTETIKQSNDFALRPLLFHFWLISTLALTIRFHVLFSWFVFCWTIGFFLASFSANLCLFINLLSFNLASGFGLCFTCLLMQSH